MTVSQACGFVGMSRQAYYQQRTRDQHAQCLEQQVLAEVASIRLQQPRLGTRKLHHLLQGSQHMHGIRLGRDRLFAILRQARCLVPARRAYHKTTHSHHRFHKHPNLLNGALKITPERADAVWVADITYLPTHTGTGYLSVVTDAYSRKIVGYHVHASLHAGEVSVAYRQALKQRSGEQPLIHHSDRGIQYCSALYQDIHQRHRVQCSMTDGYDCYQNALAERVNGILKGEFLLHTPANLHEARQMVKESVQIYNQYRPHLALKYKTPDEVHRASIQS